MRFLEIELAELQNLVLNMAALVQTAVKRSMMAVLEGNAGLAAQVIAAEPRIDAMELQVDDLASRLLVLKQPVAGDLRFLTAVIKMNSDLERVGDLAVNIAQRAISLSGSRARNDDSELSLMVNRVESMLSKSLEAFATRNEGLAKAVLTADDEIDDMRSAAYRRLVSHIEQSPEDARTDVDILFVVHSLERIADHATNIAEDVLLVINGVDVRHHAGV